MSKQTLSITLLSIALLFPSIILAKGGQHTGEKKMLDVTIEFYNQQGTTITNAYGVQYHHSGMVQHENKVYPSQYWGTYPLYFFGDEVGVKVTVTNSGPRATVNLQLTAESYVILLSGESGESLMQPKTAQFSVARGETKTIDFSFTTQYSPDAESGLDRFTVKLQHPNQGGGPGNAYPALIMEKEGVFCPPEYQK